MSTQFTNRQWRLPNNENKDKQSNYSMDFDGSQYIDTNLNTGSYSSFSVSAWIKADTLSSGKVVAAQTRKGNWSNSSWLLYIEAPGGIPYMTFYMMSGGSPILAGKNTVLSTNQWYHIVATWDGATSKVYIDGVKETTEGTVSSMNATPINTLIGSSYDSAGTGTAGGWDGQIDAVSIFDYALSQSQVTTLYGSSSTGIGNPMTLNPVAYYPLGDQDAFNGADYLVPNSSLKDYVFDFVNDNIEVDNIGSLFSGITNFSFSGWFNLTSFGGQQVFNILEGSNWKFGINTYNNQLRFNINPGVAYIANLQNITSANTWFHYAGVFDGSGASDTDRLKLYINGQPQTVTYYSTTPTSFPTLLSTADISIGGGLAPFNGMTGKASNIQLWDTNLSSTEIETLYNNGSPYTGTQPQNSNLQGWWKLDASATYDGTNWNIPDSSSNSNDGTSSGMTQANLVQSDLSFTSGYSPYALEFDSASGDYIDCGQNTNLDTGDLSVSIWINKDSTGSGTQYVFNNNNGSSIAGFCFIINNTNQVYINRRTRTKKADSGYLNIGFTEDAWHHLCFTYNDTSGAYEVYFNGNSVFTITASAKTCGISQNITIGENSGLSGLNFEGKLSNASIWNTALTSAQVSEIYNEGVPSNLNNHSAYSNLVSWWQLGSNSSFNTNWTVLDEKGSNNGTSANMGEDAIVDGVGSYANGLSSGMGGDEVIGSAPFSDANSLSINMDVLDRVEDTPA